MNLRGVSDNNYYFTGWKQGDGDELEYRERKFVEKSGDEETGQKPETGLRSVRSQYGNRHSWGGGGGSVVGEDRHGRGFVDYGGRHSWGGGGRSVVREDRNGYGPTDRDTPPYPGGVRREWRGEPDDQYDGYHAVREPPRWAPRDWRRDWEEDDDDYPYLVRTKLPYRGEQYHDRETVARRSPVPTEYEPGDRWRTRHTVTPSVYREETALTRREARTKAHHEPVYLLIEHS